MEVYWLEQSEEDVPADENWLSKSELGYLTSRRFAKRHNDWRLGRWTAKRALALRLGVPDDSQGLAKIEVRPAPSGAPEVFFEEQLAALTISLSHRARKAICAVAPPGVKLGCDLEMIEPRSPAFIADYFTAEEQTLVAKTPAADRPRLLALLWSAKESTLKALHEGLRVDTRAVTVSNVEACELNGWNPLRVQNVGGHVFHGLWRCADGEVRTLVADPPPDAPIRLEIPAYSCDNTARCG